MSKKDSNIYPLAYLTSTCYHSITGKKKSFLQTWERLPPKKMSVAHKGPKNTRIAMSPVSYSYKLFSEGDANGRWPQGSSRLTSATLHPALEPSQLLVSKSLLKEKEKGLPNSEEPEQCREIRTWGKQTGRGDSSGRGKPPFHSGRMDPILQVQLRPWEQKWRRRDPS